ncbi:P1 family peptidase [Oceanobacillus jeddahense]|uniref:P1 family peptidase n=1 Tax=Oceanobacillus jeddahense TaxID=1462527 RepID=A0ABY5JWQ8_9BACI|nr:P1 family peptidase [Oceanobacillus jeddahense]UUI04680.1 P1 family peptidase [Oceanobacillus jeddahense]
MTLSKGIKNCITDVPDVHVGHVTLYEHVNEKDTICTGVTAILPHSENLFRKKVVAGNAVINGFGKTTGLMQIDELGVLESPIMLTNTLSVGAVMQGTLAYMLNETAEIGDTAGTINLVVGECNDGYLNSIRLQAVKPEHAITAIQNAATESSLEGAVGAGTGMQCLGYKGGVGTSSRLISAENKKYTLGALVVSNFGTREQALFTANTIENPDTPDGSIMMVLATDAPFSDRQLKRLAKRCAVGLGRTGSTIDNGSGDIAIAFSTAAKINHHSNQVTESMTMIRDDHPIMNQFFQAVAEVIEEAIYRSLQQAETTVGRRGRKLEKAPI